MIDLDRLAMTDVDVMALGANERGRRLVELMSEAKALYRWAVASFIDREGKRLAATVILFSGGNDSTTLAHLFRNEATHAAHINTTIGIEQTRRFVRATCAAWGLPLLERTAPKLSDQYRALVLAQGFPGPGHHYKMFQRLKERGLDQVRRELIAHNRRERVVFLAGRRRTESSRRAAVPEFERDGSVVWVSPLVNWTKADLNTYRDWHSVPRNEVSDILHMSGECLCGCFAHEGERAELALWYPSDFALIEGLEAELANREDIPAYRRVWGWGADPSVLSASRTRSRVGRLCSSCDAAYGAA